MSAYELYPYSHGQLLEILASKSRSAPSVVQEKLHSPYFREYFDHIGAQIILVENDYIDRDYLEDYAAYYARSFQDYPRKCTRVHFFKEKLSEDDFTKMLEGAPNEPLRRSYLGFIVVKPIPRTFIGKTCLLTYGDHDERHFPIAREYKVNLFGIALSVNTIAYQEQDSTVAACATSALWSLFQCTGYLFQHHIPSPVKISESATRLLPYASRHFPNKGLNPEQMAYAIREMGLEPYLIDADNHYILKTNIRAYLSYGIPLLLGVELVEATSRNRIGLHAVAVTGYRMESPATTASLSGITVKSHGISKIYAHDDQIGPFARMEFTAKLPNELTTTWTWNGDSVIARPLLLLIPLYHKIRIPFELIIEHTHELDQQLRRVAPTTYDISWDFQLTNSSSVKSTLLGNAKIENTPRLEILKKNMPKYLWSATASIADSKLFEILFDATDLEQGDLFISLIRHEPQAVADLKPMFEKAISTGVVPNATVESVLKALL